MWSFSDQRKRVYLKSSSKSQKHRRTCLIRRTTQTWPFSSNKSPSWRSFCMQLPKVERKAFQMSPMSCELTSLMCAGHRSRPPPASHYLSPDENGLGFFPHLPLQTGKGKYGANKLLSKRKQTSDSCRKDSYGHPSLSPGIFTIFCPHGICYGFEVMQSCESPIASIQHFPTTIQSCTACHCL